MWIIPKENGQGLAFFVVVVIVAILAVFAFTVRVCSRRLHKASLDMSDYACLIGLILDIGLIVIMLGVYSHGWGEDISSFTLEEAYFAAKFFIIIDIVWNAASVAVRASMLLLYIRIFIVKPFQLVCWILIGINITILVSVILAVFLICKPLSYSFAPVTPGGHCGSLSSFELYTAVTSLINDFVIVVLPMPVLWRLQMAKKRKVGLAVVFGMGTLICAMTLVRLLISQYYRLDNYTKQAAIVGFITALEPMFGVINVCLPFFPVLVTRLSNSKFISRFTRTTAPSKKGAGNPKRGSGIRADSSGQFRGLDSVSLGPLDIPGRVYVSANNTNDGDSGVWGSTSKTQNSIVVRKDVLVERSS
ncbi:hypothetical protein HYFRA_00010093 [Hymenoscyphus fraxineus]|uniref:Rhodopsin domain-containing protein n=1 Tax=Hymenoscyphus fraxineus TaxID=746836 RepID=A0A9N9KUC4_9HELO|nr:hypothetical protein HYFRA_00010093 [Hymenoscyphus fraxineus]